MVFRGYWFVPKCLVLLGIWTIVSCLGFSMTGCQENPPPPENSNTKHGDRHAYRPDELARLKLATEDILLLEQEKKYSQIYKRYASRQLRNAITRRNFLKTTQCVEHFLGHVLTFQVSEKQIRRLGDDGQAITATVTRTAGKIQEQLTFLDNGLDFKLTGIYWSSANPDFQQCMKRVVPHASR